MADDSDDRTEAATGKRLSHAREEGNIPRSRELSTFAVTMTGIVLLLIQGREIGHFLTDLMRRMLSFDQATIKETATLLNHFKQSLFAMLWTLAPMLGTLLLVALLVPLVLGGWNFTLKAIEPKFSKLDPITGITRLFSWSSTTEALKAILKSILIGGVATWVIWQQREDIIQLVSMPLETGIIKMFDMTFFTFFIVAGAMIMLVIIDIPYTLWSYHKSLRMTKYEVKQETREADTAPEVKGRIRQLQREAARRRMMQQIPSANVIVTNPTHYAVALEYKEGMAAPQVTAKGSRKLAEKIIDVGREHRIAIMRVPSFARALYFHAELGQNIPPPLYHAAAHVLAYVYQLKLYETQGGFAPAFPDTLDVPAELDPENNDKHNRNSLSEAIR